MANTAFQIQYRQEFIAQFEQGVSWLRTVCTTEAVIKGNQAMFLVAGSGGATAVTRGLNGNIPPRVDSLTQVPATLIEWHDKPQRTEFNIFASQGDGRRIMQMSTVKVMNRKIDQDILAMLAGAVEHARLGAGDDACARDPGARPSRPAGRRYHRGRQHVLRRLARDAGLPHADPRIPEGGVRRDHAAHRPGAAVPPLGRLQLDLPSARTRRRHFERAVLRLPPRRASATP